MDSRKWHENKHPIRVTVAKLTGHSQMGYSHRKQSSKKRYPNLFPAKDQASRRPGRPPAALLQKRHRAQAWIRCPSLSNVDKQRAAVYPAKRPKRALRINSPDLDYAQALKKSGIETLEKRRDAICRKFFKNYISRWHIAWSPINETTGKTRSPSQKTILSAKM